MASDVRVGKFDDNDREAVGYLLDKFWILREREPEIYQMVREREQKLRDYFFDKCGFHLIMHREFVKLEKIPASAESWMGIEEFKHPRDYVLLCCLLAYLENKSVDEQFLLSDLCESLLALYPANQSTGEQDMNWESYECRKSLVRVLAFSTDLSIVSKVDGEINSFNNSKDNEVLFEVPIMSRYFLRSYPKDLFQFSSQNELIQAEYNGDDDQLIGRSRKYRVYRQLLLSPIFDKYDAKEEGWSSLYVWQTQEIPVVSPMDAETWRTGCNCQNSQFIFRRKRVCAGDRFSAGYSPFLYTGRHRRWFCAR